MAAASPSPVFDVLLYDYGHGGEIDGEYQTAGKQYHHTDASPVVSLYEGIVQRQIAVRVFRRLLAAGVRVVDVVARCEWSTTPRCWRDLEQADVPLGQRTRYANHHPGGLLLSGHSNAIDNGLADTSRGPSLRPTGIDVYTSRGQTGADQVATTIYNALAETAPAAGMPMRRGQWADGDVDYEAGFWMLRRTVMAAVLCELGFHTSLSDTRVLLSEQGQEALAAGLVAGVLPWMRRG